MPETISRCQKETLTNSFFRKCGVPSVMQTTVLTLHKFATYTKHDAYHEAATIYSQRKDVFKEDNILLVQVARMALSAFSRLLQVTHGTPMSTGNELSDTPRVQQKSLSSRSWWIGSGASDVETMGSIAVDVDAPGVRHHLYLSFLCHGTDMAKNQLSSQRSNSLASL